MGDEARLEWAGPPRGGRMMGCSLGCPHTHIAICCGNCDAEGCDERCPAVAIWRGCELRVRR